MNLLKYLAFFLVPAVFIAAFDVAAEQNVNGIVKVAIMPVTIESDINLDYLNEALPGMIASRLYEQDRVEIISYTEQALSDNTVCVFKGTLIRKPSFIAMKAEFISSGKTELFEVSSANPESEGEIVSLINRLCSKIKSGVFGHNAVEETVQETESDLYNIHQHPDHMIKNLDLDSK